MNKFIIYQGYINCVMDNSYFYWNTELHLVLAVCFNPRLLESLLINWKVCLSIGKFAYQLESLLINWKVCLSIGKFAHLLDILGLLLDVFENLMDKIAVLMDKMTFLMEINRSYWTK